MKLKLALKKIITPVLEAQGFQADFSNNGNYIFRTSDGSLWIKFDTAKFLPKKLRAFFSTNSGLYLALEYLKPDFFPVSGMNYETQEELEVYLIEFAKELCEIMVPYLNAMKTNYITYSLDWNHQMSQNVRERSVRFSKKWNLTIEPQRTNLVGLDAVLDKMRADASNRKRMFELHKEELIDMGAYFGELLRINHDGNGQWYWREVNGYSFFAVERGYDPMQRVIHAWNCGREAFNCEFSRYPLSE